MSMGAEFEQFLRNAPLKNSKDRSFPLRQWNYYCVNLINWE